MDAKSKADFINSFTSAETIPCPACGTNNKSDSRFCISCGNELTKAVAEEKSNSSAAFPQTSDETKVSAEATEKAADPVKVEQHVVYIEPSKAFALGLPEWSIEPPSVPIRRH